MRTITDRMLWFKDPKNCKVAPKIKNYHDISHTNLCGNKVWKIKSSQTFKKGTAIRHE